MTPDEFAKQQRDFLIRTEKESVVLLIAEFENLKQEIFGYLTKNLSERAPPRDKLSEKNFLAQFLDNLSKKVDVLSISAAQIVTRAQRRVIDFAAKSLSQLIARRIEASRRTPDKEAIQKLIGRTQDGTSLSKFFQRLKEPIREKAKEELIAAFSLGESNQSIAKRLNDVANIGKWQALTISRTETNEAYRAATRDFYESANIQKYIWMAVLDARTCLICWNLHGQIFDSRVKVFSHPNCRCVLLPFTGQKVETGAEKFARLEAGYQKQILGPSRFELYQRGAQLNDFVFAKDSDEYGKTHFIEPLESLTESKMFAMAVQESRRGSTLLTARQYAVAKSYAVKIGMPEDSVFKRENMNTSWGVMFGKEMLNVGPDSLPAQRITGRTLPPNSYVSAKGAIAHEVIGHRAAYLAGKMQDSPVLEEVQASLRAAILAPDLSVSERRMLIRDARFRLKKYDIIYQEVKDSLWLEPLQ